MKGQVSLKILKTTYRIYYLTTTNQTIAYSLSYISGKLFSKTLPELCHSPKARVSVAPNSLANQENSLIRKSRLIIGWHQSTFPELYRAPSYTKFLPQYCSFIHFSVYLLQPTRWLESSPSLFTPIKMLHIFSSFLNVT